MARNPRDSRIETREARGRLKTAAEPYWRSVSQGLAVGYRKGTAGGIWYARKMADGRYTKARLGIADDHRDADGSEVLDYGQAVRAAMAFADSKPGDRPGGETGTAGGYTVAAACADYMEDYRVRGSDFTGTQQRVDAFILPQLGEVPAERLDAPQIRAWLNALVTADPADKDATRKARATANRNLTILKAALNFAFSNGKVGTDQAWRRCKPFPGVDLPKISYLSTPEARRLVNACEPDFRVLVHGALLTGCRYGELTALRVADVDPIGGRVFVAFSKSGRPRHIPLTAEGVAFFARQITGKARDALVFARADGEAWGASWQCKRMAAACAAAGINPPVSFHILRHTYGSALAQCGVPLQAIAAALGHADTRMTERHYGHLSEQYVTDQVRANLPNFGFEPDNVVSMNISPANNAGSM